MNNLKRNRFLPHWIGVIGLLFIVFIFYSFADQERNNATFVVVLDAGHGGKDPGNLGTGRMKKTEKDVTLDVVLQVGKMIEEQCPDVKVVYTRSGDSFPSLKDRVAVANKARADVFISVHCNANANTAALGSESFVMGLHKSEESLATAMRENASIFLEDNKGSDYDGFDPNNPDTYIALSLRENVFLEQSAVLAKNVQDLFRARLGRKDRGVKQAGYYVISFTNMPSILIELGFLTNPQEEEYLQSTDGKAALSKSIFDAFLAYRKGKSKSSGEAEPGETEPIQKSEPDVMRKMVNEDLENQVIWREGDANGIWFKVQVYSHQKSLTTNQPELKGLTKYEYYIYNGQYRYTVGRSQSLEEAKKNMKLMQDWGFSDAFIVAFDNGERMDLKEAIKRAK
jgi:N-acetylmuramoyl-L-alanine amidase